MSGCFSERSFPLDPKSIVRWDGQAGAAALSAFPATPPDSTRSWLDRVHRELAPLLPNRERPVLLANQMADEAGQPIDVYRYFDRDVNKMQGLFSNWHALQHTAQSIEMGSFIEVFPELWSEFESVWVPTGRGRPLHGFLGFAQRDGRRLDADCIVVLPGLWGDNGAKRSADISLALRDSGYHVLAVEMPGHGQTEARYPDMYYTYGVLETQQLMDVSEWLQETFPCVRRTGLIGYCWGTNQALLAAWYEGRPANDESISDNIARMIKPPSQRRHYSAGVIGFSPVLRWEHFVERMDTPKCVWTDPSPAMFQAATRDHMLRKQFPEITGSLRACINYDFAYSEFGRSFPIMEGYRFLRLLDHRGMPAGDKMESARMPVLIVHSVNDPLQTAQEVVDLIAQTDNPQVAGLILPGGGHIGFQAYARAYYYSLILNFFDPDHGPAALQERDAPSLKKGPVVDRTP
jgi:predicted alpha/beta-fold hydrolase